MLPLTKTWSMATLDKRTTTWIQNNPYLQGQEDQVKL